MCYKQKAQTCVGFLCAEQLVTVVLAQNLKERKKDKK